MGLKVPAEQLLHICDPGVEENLPGTQAVQLALKGAPMEPSGQHAPAPALLYVNGAHARQTAEDVALLVALNVPDGHALHALVAFLCRITPQRKQRCYGAFPRFIY